MQFFVLAVQIILLFPSFNKCFKRILYVYIYILFKTFTSKPRYLMPPLDKYCLWQWIANSARYKSPASSVRRLSRLCDFVVVSQISKSKGPGDRRGKKEKNGTKRDEGRKETQRDGNPEQIDELRGEATAGLRYMRECVSACVWYIAW